MANDIFQDFRTNDDGDLYFDPTTGDFQVTPSDEQHMGDIIQSFPGDWKQWPQVGVGASAYLGSSGQQQELSREVIVQLKADGYSVAAPTITITPDTVTIIPNATRP